MKVFFKVVLSVFLFFLVVGIGGIFFLSRGLETVSMLEINEVNLSSLNDGVYDGTYKSGRWTNQIRVTVTHHKITHIVVVKDVIFSRPEVTEELINEVIKNQSINIDGIAGATVSSKAYLKSIENALKN